MRSLKENLHGVVDLGVVLMIGIAFVGLMVVAYILWTVRDQLVNSNINPSDVAGRNEVWDQANSSVLNITAGFDNAVNLLLIAITIFILAIAISALLLLRGR